MKRPRMLRRIKLMARRFSDARRNPFVPIHLGMAQALIVGTLSLAAAQDTAGIVFEDLTDLSEVDFVHTDGGTGQRYVIESLTAGCAVFDFDGDGLKDLYFLNGSPLPEFPLQLKSPPSTTKQSTRKQQTPANALYRNLGNWQFVDVTKRSGAGDQGYAMGVATADFDNDGDTDVYISNFGPNVLLINNGDGTFSRAPEATGVSGGERFGAGAAFFDMDSDGDLDLYCANYQKFKFEQHKVRIIAGHQFHPGPADYPPDSDLLFRNEGDGSFTDVSSQAGIDTVAATGMGVIASDIDDDGDLDIFVANDSVPNFLFINDGSGHFAEQAVFAGVAVDRSGRPNGNMGVDMGDANGDGRLDIITTTYQDEMPVLYQNLGSGLFDDVTNRSGIPTSLFHHVNWGVGFADFDNDADQDIFIACGHFMDNIAFIDDRTSVKVCNYLLANDGSGRFSDISKQSGTGLAVEESSRGAAFDDLDNDGNLDIIILNYNNSPSILRNKSTTGSSWLDLKLIGRQANRDAIGARVFVTASGRTQVAELYAGHGYQSSYGSTLHFGFGGEPVERTTASEVEIRVKWPSHDPREFPQVSTHQVIKLDRSLILRQPER
jgi:hypothetical protein